MARLKQDTYAKCEFCRERFRKWTNHQRFCCEAHAKKAKRARMSAIPPSSIQPASFLAVQAQDCRKTPEKCLHNEGRSKQGEVSVLSRNEESDSYGAIVAVLTPKLRIIRGKCNLQWVIQRLNGMRDGAPKWSGFAFCATKTGLLLRIKEHWQQTFHRKERELIPLETLVQQHCDAGAWGNIQVLPAILSIPTFLFGAMTPHSATGA